MDFVDHVDLEPAPGGRVHGVFEQLPHLVHLGIGGRIDFQEIDKAPPVDFLARRTATTGLRRHAGLTIQCFGKDAGNRRLAYASGPGEEIGVVKSILRQRMSQRPDNMILPHQGGEIARPPLAGENLITHVLCPTSNQEMEMASLTPGTCSQWLWLLPSGPDQVHHPAMRGDPPRRILSQAPEAPADFLVT